MGAYVGVCMNGCVNEWICGVVDRWMSNIWVEG